MSVRRWKCYDTCWTIVYASNIVDSTLAKKRNICIIIWKWFITLPCIIAQITEIQLRMMFFPKLQLHFHNYSHKQSTSRNCPTLANSANGIPLIDGKTDDAGHFFNKLVWWTRPNELKISRTGKGPVHRTNRFCANNAVCSGKCCEPYWAFMIFF